MKPTRQARTGSCATLSALVRSLDLIQSIVRSFEGSWRRNKRTKQIYILERLLWLYHGNQIREEQGSKLGNQVRGYSTKIVGDWTRVVRVEMEKGTMS